MESTDPWDETIYEPDQLIDENNLTGNRNRIFKNLQDSSKVIDHYIISEDEKRPFLLCHFLSELQDESTLQITCFNAKEQPINIKWIEYSQILKNLPTIELPRNTTLVSINLIEKSVYDEPVVMNQDSIHTFNRLVLWLSLTLFFLFIPIGYFSLQILSGPEFDGMLNERTLGLGITLMVFTSIIHYMFLRNWFRKHHK